jgi:hypothetical protein
LTNPEFPAIPWAGPASSGRSRAGLGPMRYVVWHATANPTSNAWGEAAFARNRTDGVGTHAAADATVCLQTQVTTLSVGHVGSGTGNRYGVAIECCGVNADSAAHWRPIIDQCVPFVRAVMAKHGIANRWLTIEQMRDGHSTGHVTHDMARLAWGGTDHTDPGPNFPKSYVTAAVAGGVALSPPGGFLMALTEDQQQDLWEWMALLVDPGTPAGGRATDRFHFPPLVMQAAKLVPVLQTQVTALTATVQALADAVNSAGGDVNTAAIFAKIDEATAQVNAEVDEATAAAVAAGQEARDAVGDLGEGGTAQVREDAPSPIHTQG